MATKTPEKARQLFQQRYEQIKGFAKDTGIDIIRIDSNLNEFIKLNFKLTHICRNISAVLQLQKLFGKYIYASTYHYQNSFIGKMSDIAFADPATIHLLSTEQLQCISSGCQYQRAEKTLKVAELDLARKYLNVCVNSDGQGQNCSMCKKCLRTMLVLDVAGKLERFSEVFDLRRYKMMRWVFIGRVLCSPKDILGQEVLEFARTRKIRIPFWYRLARLLPLKYFQKKCARKYPLKYSTNNPKE